MAHLRWLFHPVTAAHQAGFTSMPSMSDMLGPVQVAGIEPAISPYGSGRGALPLSHTCISPSGMASPEGRSLPAVSNRGYHPLKACRVSRPAWWRRPGSNRHQVRTTLACIAPPDTAGSPAAPYRKERGKRLQCPEHCWRAAQDSNLPPAAVHAAVLPGDTCRPCASLSRRREAIQLAIEDQSKALDFQNVGVFWGGWASKKPSALSCSTLAWIAAFSAGSLLQRFANL